MTETKRKISSLAPYKVKDGSAFIFLQKRSKDASRYPGLFGFFGGGAEENETPEEALFREIKEELDFIPKNLKHFGEYDLPVALMDLFVSKVNDDFEKEITVSEGEYGKWFNEEDFEKERDFITGDLTILEELYEKLPNL
ncbi:MAG: NUDIX domain-containing protein [Candidatus Pacebacteria bacterium]|nr:NUDIX domain-containing protein [Candidatus Paceibacterota bacterium]